MNIVTFMRLFKIIIIMVIATAIGLARGMDYDLFDINNEDIVNYLETTVFDISRTLTDSDILEVILSLNAVSLLQIDLYLHTHVINKRNILDSPLFLPQRIDYSCDWIIGGHLFLNQMNRGFFTEHSSAVESYLAVQCPELIEEFNNSEIKKILDSFKIDPLNILPLFRNITIQERKFGLMFHADRQCRYGNFRLLLPIYYFERNFFLTKKEEKIIESRLGASNEKDKFLFARRHLISDRFGIGDLRLLFDFNPIDHGYCSIFPELFITIPVSYAFKKGLLGKEFKRNCHKPTLDFKEIFSLATGNGVKADRAAAFALLEDFFITVIDNLSANVLTTGLGYDGHFGLGFNLNATMAFNYWIKRCWADQCLLVNDVTFEYLFPATETRSFIEKDRLDQFNKLNLTRNPVTIIKEAEENAQYAEQVLTFLEETTVNQLVPFAFKTKVLPGVIVHITNKLFYEGIRCGFYVGSDFWVQAQERLCNKRCLMFGKTLNLNNDKATRCFAYQEKIIASVFYKVMKPASEWTFALNGDVTVANSGIGADFTISLNIETNF